MRSYLRRTSIAAGRGGEGHCWRKERTSAGSLPSDRLPHAIHSLLTGRALDDSDLAQIERLARSGSTEFLRAAAEELTRPEPARGIEERRARHQRRGLVRLGNLPS